MSSRLVQLVGPAVALSAATLIAVAAACGSGGPTTTQPSRASSSTTASNVATSAPAQTRREGESEGSFVFRTQCAGCHGSNGEGNLGPSLVGVADRMTVAAQVTLVRTGRGRMPAFSPALSEQDIAAVVDYTRGKFPAASP